MRANASGKRSAAVTPHDTAEIPAGMRQLWVGTGGTIVGRLKDDEADQTWTNIPNGTKLDWEFLFIRATNTTVSGLVAIY